MEETLTKLIQAVENVAPLVWESAYKQAVINGAIGVVFSVLLIAFSVYCSVIGFRYIAKHKQARNANGYNVGDGLDDDAVFWTTFSVVLCEVVAGTIGIIVLATSLPALLNPNWGAIQIIMSTIRG